MGLRREPFWTGPNVLSLARVPLGFAFAWALRLTPPDAFAMWPAAVLVLAGLTDALDGAWARRRAAARARIEAPGVRPPGLLGPPAPGRGSWLDPICDKLFVATVLVSLLVERRVSLSLLALIAARELAQLPLALIYRLVPFLRRWLHYDFTASLLGKLATVAQFAAIATLLIAPDKARVPAYVAFGLGVVALGDYLVRAWRIGLERRRAEKTAASAGKP